LRGGSGPNVVWGDGGIQNMVLGEGDDELHGGAGNDVVGSKGGNDQLFGDEGNDVVFGGEGRDTLHGGSGNDALDGDEGLDMAAFNVLRANAQLSLRGDHYRVDSSDGGTLGRDTLTEVERLAFSDGYIALDLDGGAGMVAKIFAAVFGVESLSDERAVGSALALLDHGMSYEQLAQWALTETGLSDQPADYAAVVTLLYSNLVGQAPSQTELDLYVGLLAGGGHTLSSLVMFAAEQAENLANVDFEALAQTGLKYADQTSSFLIPDFSDLLAGGRGVDTAAFEFQRGLVEISVSESVTTVVTEAGTQQLMDVERLRFEDSNLAFDLDGNAGITAKVIAAVFGSDAVSNEEYAGYGLMLLDNGMSYEQLMELALGAALSDLDDHAAVVGLLYGNVVGGAVDPAEQLAFVDQLDSGVHSIGSLGVFAAEHGLNQGQIDLVGLASTGLAYVDLPGTFVY